MAKMRETEHNMPFNANKAGLFERRFFWGAGGGGGRGGQFELLPLYLTKNLSNMNITLHNC